MEKKNDPSLNIYTNINSKWTAYLSGKPKAVELPEENREIFMTLRQAKIS